jgi:hypothetical protein
VLVLVLLHNQKERSMVKAVRSGNLLLVGEGAKKMAKAVQALSKTPEGEQIAKRGRSAGQRAARMLKASGLAK